MRRVAGLQRVDREIEQDLQEVGPVDLGDGVGQQVVDDELMPECAGMADEQILQIDEHLLHAHVSVLDLGGVEEAEVAARNLEAAPDLAVQAVEIAFDRLELLTLELRGVLHRAVDQFDETADHGQRAVDVVQHARVNLALGPRHFLAHTMVGDFLVQRFELVMGVAEGKRGPAFLEGPRDRRAHCRDVEWACRR